MSYNTFYRSLPILNKNIERNKKRKFQEKSLKLTQININVPQDSYDEFSFYIKSLPYEMILFGLRFAYKRHSAESGGYLFPGRKSLIKRETDLLSKEQANWRLDNWKKMIKSYREKGYSYPTISRIKKEIKKVATS